MRLSVSASSVPKLTMVITQRKSAIGDAASLSSPRSTTAPPVPRRTSGHKHQASHNLPRLRYAVVRLSPATVRHRVIVGQGAYGSLFA
jgi:hypothetical protein